MKLQFKIQPHQTSAVDAVVECFAGQPRDPGLRYRIDPGRKPARAQPALDGVDDANELDAGLRNATIRLTADQLLGNIQTVQRAPGRRLESSQTLASSKAAGRPGVPNLTVEMETGTGKTYVYIKTLMELHKRYGWSKFIVVVPSIAIREGVKQSFDATAEHFVEHYGHRPRAFIYDSKQLDELEAFSSNGGVQVMIINVQAFNAIGKDQRRIYDELDDFGSRRPIDVIKANRPILIIDEPQKLGLEFHETTGKPLSKPSKTLGSLAKFDPLAILRYSATHKPNHDYNKVHRLDAIDAYNQKLVKKIAVRGISVRGLGGTAPYLYVEEIQVRSGAKPRARIELEVKLKSGTTKRKTCWVEQGRSLYAESGELEAYKGLTVTDVDAILNRIELSSGLVVTAGDITIDPPLEHKRRIQIREAIRAHVAKERQLHPLGVKALSLFFIDEVAKYRDYEREDTLGDYARMFESEYSAIRDEVVSELPLTEDTAGYQDYLRRDEVQQVHAGYFSIDKKTKHFTDPKKIAKKGEDAGQADDVDAYDLILRDKERLLSLDEPVRFLFSHSALREGWDNPNVFVMGMLKRSDNTVSRRQEIGRGLRLAVDQYGDRVDDPSIAHQVNELTIVTDESYTDFALGLQKEISESLSARPRKADKEYFVGKQITTAGGTQTIDDQLARQIHNYLLKNKYIDEADDTVTDAFKDAYADETLVRPAAEPLAEVFDVVVPLIAELYLGVPKAEDGRTLKDIPFNEANFNRREFQELWSQINHRATFQVDFDSAELVANCVKALDAELRVERLRYVVETGAQRADLGADDLARGVGFEQQSSRTHTETRAPASDVRYDLLGEIAEQTKLTRRTVCRVLQGIAPRTFAMFAQNPEHFIAQSSRIIKEQTAAATVESLTYNLLDKTYDQSIFTIDRSSLSFANAEKTQKHIYDFVVADSTTERRFAAQLERSDEVVVYAKLPKGFLIPTPVGDYNPDWAIAFERGKVRQIYFVAETKGELTSMEFGLRGLERAKIECARRFFQALTDSAENDKVRYDVVADYDQLMSIVS